MLPFLETHGMEVSGARTGHRCVLVVGRAKILSQFKLRGVGTKRPLMRVTRKDVLCFFEERVRFQEEMEEAFQAVRRQ